MWAAKMEGEGAKVPHVLMKTRTVMHCPLLSVLNDIIHCVIWGEMQSFSTYSSDFLYFSYFLLHFSLIPSLFLLNKSSPILFSHPRIAP